MRKAPVVLLVALLLPACGGQAPTGTPVAPSPIPPTTPTPPIPVPAGPQVFVGAGDIAMCDQNSETTARLLDGIGGTVFTLGDNAYFQGTRQQFRDCYEPTWGRHKARTRPVPGNHDYESPGAQPYFEYFGPNAAPPDGFYSFTVGAWHVIALNSNIPVGAGSAQAGWLRDDLAANRSRCTLAYWHHPLFTSGPDGDTLSVREFWRLLYEANAEVVLNGHEHLYERFSPQDPDGRTDPSRGIRQFIAGTGGAVLYQPVTTHLNSQRIISAFGVLKLTLSSDSYEWEFLPAPGSTAGADRGTGACH